MIPFSSPFGRSKRKMLSFVLEKSRVTRRTALLTKLLGLAYVSTSIFSVAFGQGAAQRDQQALTIIAQTIAAGGGQDRLNSIQDFTETGTVTYYLDPEVSGTATIKSRGLRQFRMDAELPGGQRSTIVNGRGGSLIDADGRFLPIHSQSAADLGSFAFPYIALIAAVHESSISAMFVGLVKHNGASVYDVRIQKTYPATQDDPERLRGIREGRDFFIDPNTFLVTSIWDVIQTGASPSEGPPHEIVYSNYQQENGILMPLTVSETVRGVTGFTIQIGQVTFNSNLRDDDFRW